MPAAQLYSSGSRAWEPGNEARGLKDVDTHRNVSINTPTQSHRARVLIIIYVCTYVYGFQVDVNPLDSSVHCIRYSQ